MARFRQQFDKIKIPITILTILGGLTLYTIGYLPDELIVNKTINEAVGTGQDSLYITSIALRAIFSTCRIFIMESDFSEVNAVISSNGFYMFGFSLIHALGAMLTIMTILSFFGIKFLSRLKLIFANCKQLYIFLGFNDATLNLIRSLKSEKKSRSFIVVESLQDGEEDGDLLIRLREDGFILIDAIWQDINCIKSLHIPKRLLRREVHFLALSNEENKNVKNILNLLSCAKKEKMNDNQVYFYVNTTDENAEKYFEAKNREQNTNFEIKTFSVPDLTARQLFYSYPIHDYIPIDKNTATAFSGLTIFIAGLDTFGIEILRKSIYLGQFIGGEYKAIVTDEEMTRKKGLLYNKYPGLKKNYQIETYEAVPGSEEFYQVLEKNLHNINYIVVALGNDTLNIETATEIQRLVNRSQVNHKPIIAVHIIKDEDFEHLEKYRLFSDIRFFGRSPDIFTENIIINEAMDKMARKMNALFNSIYKIEPADNWGKLDTFTKESNRAAALNISTKLKLLGLEAKEISCDNDIEINNRAPVNLNDYLTGERLDNLAKQEHLRWNAFHFASGWVTWPLDKIDNPIKAKDLANKRHACLVSWDELEDVTSMFNQNPSYQQLDYEQVKNVSLILEHAGYDVFEKLV